VSRDWRLFWTDIITFCGRVESYTAGMSRQSFFANQLVFDAVLRNLELIGEAAKHLPPEALSLAPTIKWTLIRRMRNVVAHVYFGLDDDVVWDAITCDVPDLRRTLEAVTLP
jgi:uncharacterized protein with HEPN domain